MSGMSAGKSSGTLVTPTAVGTDESYPVFTRDSLSDDAGVKSEVAVSSKADFPGALPVDEGVRKRFTSAGGGLCAGPDGELKTEVEIAPPSKRAAAESEFTSIASAV